MNELLFESDQISNQEVLSLDNTNSTIAVDQGIVKCPLY